MICAFSVSVLDSDGAIVYRVPQFNMVAHGVGNVADGIDEGQIMNWVRIKALLVSNKEWTESRFFFSLVYTYETKA